MTAWLHAAPCGRCPGCVGMPSGALSVAWATRLLQVCTGTPYPSPGSLLGCAVKSRQGLLCVDQEASLLLVFFFFLEQMTNKVLLAQRQCSFIYPSFPGAFTERAVGSSQQRPRGLQGLEFVSCGSCFIYSFLFERQSYGAGGHREWPSLSAVFLGRGRSRGECV